MANSRPNPFGVATPLGEGLANTFAAFMQAPTPEERAANALKIHGMQIGAKRDLAAAGYDTSRTEGQDITNSAMRQLPGLDYTSPQAPGILLQSGQPGNQLADIFATTMALKPGATMESMDPMIYASGKNFGNTSVGFREDQGRQFAQNESDNATTARGQDLTHRASIYNTDQTQAGQDRRFSVTTPQNAITTVPSNSPIATAPEGNTTIEGPRSQPGAAGRPPIPRNYITPDKQKGITYDGLTDGVTNAPLPQGTTLGGSTSMGGYTEQQSRDATFAYRMDGALKNLAGLGENFDPRSVAEFMLQDSSIPWTDLNVGNAMISPERQRYQQAMREILAVYLRKDSGAAITPEEVKWYGPMLMPLPFEDEATVAQKINAINGMRTSLLATSGGAYDEIIRRASEPGNEVQMPWLQQPGATNTTSPQPGQLATPQPGQPAGGDQTLKEAQDALARGADPAAVRSRYKQMTGQDMP